MRLSALGSGAGCGLGKLPQRCICCHGSLLVSWSLHDWMEIPTLRTRSPHPTPSSSLGPGQQHPWLRVGALADRGQRYHEHLCYISPYTSLAESLHGRNSLWFGICIISADRRSSDLSKVTQQTSGRARSDPS